MFVPNFRHLERAVTEPWKSVAQVAEHLDLGRDSVFQWIGYKYRRKHRVSNLYKFKVSEVGESARLGDARVQKEQD